MLFTTTDLVGNKVLIEGTDIRGNEGSVVLFPLQWTEIKRRRDLEEAHATFDSKVEAFFADLTDAADLLDKAHKVDLDPLLYIVEQEGTVGTPSAREVVTELDDDSVILRAIESGHADRVIWVNGSLTLLRRPTPVPAPDEDDAFTVPVLEAE